ncbi:MAG: hypothetical protein AB9903_03110 [Vulcanimicrobiota bacterium]
MEICIDPPTMEKIRKNGDRKLRDNLIENLRGCLSERKSQKLEPFEYFLVSDKHFVRAKGFPIK